MKYILHQEGDSLQLLDAKRNSLPVTQILDDYPAAHVLAFNGQMGAGKTTFIKQICLALGVTDVVNSPTFAIVNVYDCKDGEIYHMDCYRLKNAREAVDFGIEDYLYSGNYCFIEWPDIVSDLLPTDTLYLNFSLNTDGDRTITIDE